MVDGYIVPTKHAAAFAIQKNNHLRKRWSIGSTLWKRYQVNTGSITNKLNVLEINFRILSDIAKQLIRENKLSQVMILFGKVWSSKPAALFCDKDNPNIRHKRNQELSTDSISWVTISFRHPLTIQIVIDFSVVSLKSNSIKTGIKPQLLYNQSKDKEFFDPKKNNAEDWMN